MTKEAFLAFCGAELGTGPDYPFDEDFETADSTVEFLANVSYDETKTIPRRRKNESGRNL